MKVKFFDRDMNLLDIRNCQEVSYTRQKNKEYSISFTPVVEKGYDLSQVYFVSFLDDSKGNRLPYSPCGKLVSVSLDGKCKADSIEKYLADVSLLPDKWQWWKGKSLKRVIENHVYGFRTIRFASESELATPYASHHVDVSSLENGNGEVYAGKGNYWGNNNPYELYFYSDGYVIYRIEIPTEARRQDMVLRWGDVTGGATDIMVRFAWSDDPDSYGEWTTGVSPIRGEGIRPNETEGIDIPESDKKYLFVRFNFQYDTGTISTGFPRGINYSKEITTNREDDNNYVYYGTTAILNYFEIIYRVDTFVQVGTVAVSDSKLLGADVFEKENLLESLKAISEAYNLVFFCQIDDGAMTLNCFDSYVEDRTNEFIISDTKNMRVSRKDVAIDFIQAVEAYGAGSDNDRIHTFVEYTQDVTVNNVKKFEDSEAHTIEELRESALQYIDNENNDITNVSFEYYAHALSLGDKVKLIVDKKAITSVVTEEKISVSVDGIKKEYVIGVKEYPFRTLFANPFSGKFLEKPKVPTNFVVTRMADGWHATWKGETEKYILRYRRSDTSPYNTHTIVGQQFVFPYTEYEKAYEFVLFAVGENGLVSDGTKTTEVYSGVNNSIESIVNGTADVGRPDQLENVRATASRDGISFYCDILGDGLKNTLGRIDWEIKASGEQWASARKISTTVFAGTYNFDRVKDGYPEKDAVGLWEVRAKAVNGYGFESEFYSAVAVVNADNYGTWIQEKPTVFNIQSANRAVNVSWQRPANSLGKEIYGLKYYEIQISKNGTNWHKPAVNKTGKDSESDWYDGTGQLRNDSANYTQSLPLTGQTLSLPENTTYYFRVRTVGETNTSDWSDTQTGIALATGIGDIISGSVTEQILAPDAVTYEKLNVLAVNKINSFVKGKNDYWTTNPPDAGTKNCTIETDAETGLQCGVLSSNSNGITYSNSFEVLPDDILEVNITFYKNVSIGTTFIGVQSYAEAPNWNCQEANYNTISKSWGVFNNASNLYFLTADGSTTRQTLKTYIVGYNVTPDKIPAPNLATACARMLPGQTKANLRILNYYNAGTTTKLYILAPRVTNIAGGQLLANQIITPSLSAINANVGEITSGILRANIKAGESKPNVFLDLDTEEFRVGNNPSLQDSNHVDAEYLHWKPNQGLFLKLKNLIVDAIASTIRGRFRVRGTTATMAQSVLVVNPESTADPDTKTPANTTDIKTAVRCPAGITGNLTGNATTATAPFYQWEKTRPDLFRYVAGESPTMTFYWHKLCKITTAMTFDIELVGDVNYSYKASYRLSVSTYTDTSHTSYSVSLLNLGQAVKGEADLAVALDADGYLYIQANAKWGCALFVTLLYSLSSDFSVTMDKLGYAPFGTASGFTPVNLITQTGAFRWNTSGSLTTYTPIINTDITGNVTGNLTGNVTGNLTGNADTATTATTANVRVSLRHSSSFYKKTWAGLTDLNGLHVWTDDDNIYLSYEGTQYVLNKSTSTWVKKTWNGLTSFFGSNTWTDGSNILYSRDETQYVLNKSTSTWAVKTWNGLTSFDGDNVWTDGENIYHSYRTTQMVLNKATSTWTTKTWNGLTNFYGYDIWTDGDNIYHSRDTTQYVLNKSTSTWSTKTWNGLTDFRGHRVWTDGSNIYHSYRTTHMVLNKSTSTWAVKTWNGLTNFYGYDIWTDGDNIYHSRDTTQYVLPATRHNYVDDDKYQGLFGVSTSCRLKTLSKEFVFSNE